MLLGLNNRHKSLMPKILSSLDQNYCTYFGICYFLLGLFFFFNSSTSTDYKFYLFCMSLALFTGQSEIRRNVKWFPFLILAVPILIFVQYINVHGYTLWGKMLSWQISKGIIINLNPIFKNIPFNNAAFARIYQPKILTRVMRLVYQNGFVIPALIPFYRSMIMRDFKKMLKYLLSAHVFQVFLITPFYLLFHLQEVWYVLGDPDGMARHLSLAAAAAVTINCFPSMHTSIAFAMFLVVLKENNKLFKWIWGGFCLSVIFSTMYLEIHWVLDVVAGILLAYVTVKMVDSILERLVKVVSPYLRLRYFTNPDISLSEYNSIYF